MIGILSQACGTGYFESGDSAWCTIAIFQPEHPPVRLGDLTRQHEPHTTAVRLGGKERHEEILGIREATPLVDYLDHKVAMVISRHDRDVPPGSRQRFDRVP